jgi:hypothetical protein
MGVYHFVHSFKCETFYPNFKLTLVIIRIHEEKEFMPMVRKVTGISDHSYLTQNPVDLHKT